MDKSSINVNNFLIYLLNTTIRHYLKSSSHLSPEVENTSPSHYSTSYIISRFCEDILPMSTTSVQAEASKPQQQKKMQECNRCKAAGFPNQLIDFEKIGEDPTTGKIRWKLIDGNGAEHKHKFIQNNNNNNNNDTASVQNENNNSTTTIFKRRRIVDIATVTAVEEAKKLLALGWEYKTSYPATIAYIPHYVLVKRE